MVISNIGTIVLSLPPFSIESIPSDVTAKQVKLLSLSNTISKLTVGAMVDYVSPVASYLPNVGHTFPRKHRITRIAFLALSALILASTFLWMKTRVLTRDDVWALRYIHRLPERKPVLIFSVALELALDTASSLPSCMYPLPISPALC